MDVLASQPRVKVVVCVSLWISVYMTVKGEETLEHIGKMRSCNARVCG